MTNPVGRPPFFKTPEELEAKIDDYFNNCPETDKRGVVLRNKEGDTYIDYINCFTVCGLALHLGFTSRNAMYNYEEKEEFIGIIKKARTLIEKGYEQNLHGGQCTGSIFALKNMGWNDKVINENHTYLDVSVPARQPREEWEKHQEEKNEKQA